MAVQFSPKAQKQIDELIASGRYADEGTVVEAAITRLAADERKLEKLKAELAVALKQVERGEVTEFTRELADDLIRQARENAKAGKPINDAVTP